MTELLFRDDAYLKSCEAQVVSATADDIRLDRTVFYTEGGGQPGDTGTLTLDDGSVIKIVDTLKGEAHDDILHVPAEGSALPAPGDKVTAEIDWDRRHRLMRMHSCLHLLCAAVEGDVTGGQVSDGKGRIDFNLPDTSLDKEAIANTINTFIAEDHPVRTRWITDEDLAQSPELVRTMSVKPPKTGGRVRLLEIESVDLQPCGGTHVKSTGETGPIEVGKVENKGRQNRRVTIRFKT